MSDNVTESQSPVNLTASAQITDGEGDLVGIWVSSASSTPTIKVWNGPAASGAVIANTFTPTAPYFYAMPFKFLNGCYVTISGTVDCTVSWKPR